MKALPTTAVLAEHYGVSQATITRVLRAGAAEGLVSTVPRWGRCQLLEVGFDEIRLLSAGLREPPGTPSALRPGTWCSVKASRVSWTSPPA